MKKIIMFIVLLIPPVASAGMYKCISPKGGVTYSDSPCAVNSGSSTKLPIENNPRPTPRGGIPSWESDHDRVVMKHIGMGELDVAERLAVTSRQMNMVIKAKNLKILERVTGNSKDMKDRNTAAGSPETFQQNPIDRGISTDPATMDFDVRMKAKQDYQKQQIPGFITRQPTEAHDIGVYKQEMNRQKNMDPNTWSR